MLIGFDAWFYHMFIIEIDSIFSYRGYGLN